MIDRLIIAVSLYIVIIVIPFFCLVFYIMKEIEKDPYGFLEKILNWLEKQNYLK